MKPYFFLRKLRGLFLAFARTFVATQQFRRLRNLPQPPERWDDPRVKAVSLNWGLKVLRDLNVSVKVLGAPCPQPAIFVGNHLSYIDIVALYSVTHLCFVAKSEVGNWPIIGPATRMAGSILVERGSTRSRVETAEEIAKAVSGEGKQVCIFPEGTTSIQGKAWRKGVFRIAHENDLWVQPMGFVYEPVRRAAYIDDDTLFFHMWKLIQPRPTQLTLKFFEPRKIRDVEQDMKAIESEVRSWVDGELQKQGYFESAVEYVE